LHELARIRISDDGQATQYCSKMRSAAEGQRSKTSATTNMIRRQSRCACGLRLLAQFRMATGRPAGLHTAGIIAPYVLDGAMNGAIFRGYVEQMLPPMLSAGDIVVMDNLPCHKVAGIQEAIKNCEAKLLYLPSCSPDLNPIEQAFAKSRRCCEKQPSGHAMVSGMPLPTPSNSTVQTSVETSFGTQAIQPDRLRLNRLSRSVGRVGIGAVWNFATDQCQTRCLLVWHFATPLSVGTF
jgi:hypothetical protein